MNQELIEIDPTLHNIIVELGLISELSPDPIPYIKKYLNEVNIEQPKPFDVIRTNLLLNLSNHKKQLRYLSANTKAC